jgi:HEAT repeat protein
MLLEAARSDPDREVREQAVFWLGQVNTEKALSAIEGVLNSSTNADVQEKAIFALSQHRSPRASQILREWAQGANRPAELREKAIFWLSQQRDAENGRFLRELYARLTEENLKERVIFALSQRRGEGNERWMMDLALNANESIELRKKALFWAGQMRTTPIADFITLYDRINDREMKEQLIFVFSQRREPEVVDKLMDIVRNDKDPELRKKAIFWLGQSKDPRAVKFLQDVIGD